MTTVPPRPGKTSPRQAAALLAERDPVVARLVQTAGVPRFLKPTQTPFAALVRSITQQQLGGPAAAAIHHRLLVALDGDVTLEHALAIPVQALRDVGLSAAKAASVQDLAARVLDGAVILDPRRLARLSDNDVVDNLTHVDTPTPKQLELLGESYRPYRSVLAWYCWQGLALSRT